MHDRKTRLKHAIEYFNLDRKSIVKALGYKKGYIDQLLSGPKDISDSFVHRFTKRYIRVNEDWLLHGHGEMLNPEKPEIIELKESGVPYRKTTPGEQLQHLLDGHEKRIDDLETEIRLLKDMEAEVHRLRGMVEGLMKDGAVKE